MWCDRDTEHDCLGFIIYVDVLAEVCGLSDLVPLTMGIFGSWGSGKTSLMRMLQRRIYRGFKHRSRVERVNMIKVYAQLPEEK